MRMELVHCLLMDGSQGWSSLELNALIEMIFFYYQYFQQFTSERMEEDSRSNKEILLVILEKCKEALPEVATLMKRLDKINLQQTGLKIRQKDCLNPKFLMQLSECGEQIKNILHRAIDEESLSKESLKYYYKQYMEVIYSIRKYHEEAHLSHDIHKNSTKMKENLLNELKSESIKRQELKKELEYLRKELVDRDLRISQLETAMEGKDNHMNLSQISQISKKIEAKYGQLYGGQSRVGQIEEDEQTIQGKRLRKRILELEQAFEQKEHQLQNKETQYERTVEELQNQIIQLQTKFEQFYSTNTQQPTKVQTFKEFKSTTMHSRQDSIDHEQMFRFLLIQSSTIEQYLKQSQDD